MFDWDLSKLDVCRGRLRMWYVYGYDIELYKITESGDLIFVEKK